MGSKSKVDMLARLSSLEALSSAMGKPKLQGSKSLGALEAGTPSRSGIKLERAESFGYTESGPLSSSLKKRVARLAQETQWIKPLVRGMNRFAQGNRNHDLVRGIGRYSRSAMYHKRGLWALKAKNGGYFPMHLARTMSIKEGSKAPKFYPADDVARPLHKNTAVHHPKLRANITPGTVLILLAGRSKGKRVIFLKQLDSGLLLITGPFRVNGVPLRRVNQAYVIGTSTKINIGSVLVSNITDSYFKRIAYKQKKGEDEFFQGEDESEKEIQEERKSDQTAVDDRLSAIIAKVPDMKAYLSTRFSLRSGVKPHELVF